MRPQVYLIDWDDTLFPTTWLFAQTSPNYSVFPSLDDFLKNWLTCLRAVHAHIVIVTNASSLHVHDCLARYLPMTQVLFQKLNIPIISARDLYQAHHPHSSVTWKRLAFTRVLKQMHHEHRFTKNTEIVVIGDGPDEEHAAQTLRKHDLNVTFRHMKETPTAHDIKTQLREILVTTALHGQILGSPRNRSRLSCSRVLPVRVHTVRV
jgi:predicted HAD superfamily phosphohydrolase YqeG